MQPVNELISDWTECPRCDAENRRLGSGRGHADRYFNLAGLLWAVCSVHNVRWAVTRELGGWPVAAPTPEDGGLPVVEAVWRIDHDGRHGGHSGP